MDEKNFKRFSEKSVVPFSLNAPLSKERFQLRFISGVLTVGTTVMKNCEPFVFGPALAMLTVNGRSCRKFL